MIVNEKYKFIFFHLPKTGGSSAVKWFGKAEGQMLHLQRDAHMTPDEFFNTYIDAHKVKDFYRFCFVRNPWRRMESAYKHLSKTGSPDRWDKMPFHTFVESLEDGYGKKCYDVYPVMRPQADWLAGREYIVDWPHEELEYQCEDIARMLGCRKELPRVFPHLNASPGKVYWTKTALETFEYVYAEDIAILDEYEFTGEMM